jgi:hypothetical protein
MAVPSAFNRAFGETATSGAIREEKMLNLGIAICSLSPIGFSFVFAEDPPACVCQCRK